MPKVKMIGTILLVLGGIVFAITTALTPQDPYMLTLGMLFFTFGANWTMGLYFAEGMEILPDIKGVTASLLTSARLLVTAVIVGLASYFYDNTIVPIAVTIIGVVLICVPIIIFYERRKRLNPFFGIITSSFKFCRSLNL